MKKYEIMYILKANLDDATRNELIGKLNNYLTVENGTIDNVKELAYEIKFQKKGYYVVIEASVSSSKVVDEFARRAKLNANVLRHLVIAK